MGLTMWTEFFGEMENVRGRSRNTILALRRDLELFAEFSDKNKEILAFYDYMSKQQLSTRSQARIISSLRTYYKFLEKNGRPSPELRLLKPPRVKPKLPRAITAEEFSTLYKAVVVDDNFRTARNQITLLLLFGLGCRVSELIALNLSDFHETDSWLSITGKGQKQRVIPLTEKLLNELRIYIKEVRPHLLKDKTQAVLINDRGNRPSRVDVWRWLAAWSARAGFSEPISPHKFRHGCATALLESGADLRSIQMLLGHSSIQTTQIYTSVTTENIKKTVDEFHPLSRLD